jgi:hypothetical protein
VQYRLLPGIVEQEGTHFQSFSELWRPTELLFIQQIRELLHDMQSRYDRLVEATGELETLTYAAKYIKVIQGMRLLLREANFQWKADQLRFLRAASQFYSGYGTVLRFLRFEQARGTFS